VGSYVTQTKLATHRPKQA